MCQPPIPSPSLPHPLALGNHKSVLSVCECVFYAYSTSPRGLASSFRRYTGRAMLESGLSAVGYVTTLPGFPWLPGFSHCLHVDTQESGPPSSSSSHASSRLFTASYQLTVLRNLPAPLHHCTRCPVITSPSARPQSESSAGSWLLSFAHASLIFLASNVSFNFLNQGENDGAV